MYVLCGHLHLLFINELHRIRFSSRLLFPQPWVSNMDYPDSLREAFETFRKIQSEVPKLEADACRYRKFNEMPWMDVVPEIADGVRRQDTRLESAADIMSIADLRKYVQEWRKDCESVDKLIRGQLLPELQAAKILATFSRPGAYEQPCLC